MKPAPIENVAKAAASNSQAWVVGRARGVGRASDIGIVLRAAGAIG